MQAALGSDHRPECVDLYFQRLADLCAFSLVTWKEGVDSPVISRCCDVEEQAPVLYRKALAEGRGVVMTGPHLICHEMMAGVAAQRERVTVLVRESPYADYEAIKQRWYSQLGLQTVYRPRRGAPGEGLAEITTALRVLRAGQILAITPDLVRKPGTGVPVRLFGREVDLPAGAFFLSLRSGAPLIPSFFHYDYGENRYLLPARQPLEAGAGLGREEAVRELGAAWAGEFESFVRAHPEMWQFWLDKRWAAWLGVD